MQSYFLETDSMRNKIISLVKNLKSVSFSNFIYYIKEFKGDQELLIKENLILWSGVSKEACEELLSLLKENIIEMKPTSKLTYLIDGNYPNLKIATSIRDYKHPRWLPVVFDIVE